jgi:hypothetical protein
MQTKQLGALKIVRMTSIVAVFAYGVLALFSTYVVPSRYSDCERNTKELNGGEKVLAGRKYKIILCGDGGDTNFMQDKIRMQIFSESGSLLAQRHFYVDWPMTNVQKRLVYGDDYLIYFDPYRPDNYKRKVSMPPTRLDWIRARLPLID